MRLLRNDEIKKRWIAFHDALIEYFRLNPNGYNELIELMIAEVNYTKYSNNIPYLRKAVSRIKDGIGALKEPILLEYLFKTINWDPNDLFGTELFGKNKQLIDHDKLSKEISNRVINKILPEIKDSNTVDQENKQVNSKLNIINKFIKRHDSALHINSLQDSKEILDFIKNNYNSTWKGISRKNDNFLNSEELVWKILINSNSIFDTTLMLIIKLLLIILYINTISILINSNIKSKKISMIFKCDYKILKENINTIINSMDIIANNIYNGKFLNFELILNNIYHDLINIFMSIRSSISIFKSNNLNRLPYDERNVIDNYINNKNDINTIEEIEVLISTEVFDAINTISNIILEYINNNKIGIIENHNIDTNTTYRFSNIYVPNLKPNKNIEKYKVKQQPTNNNKITKVQSNIINNLILENLDSVKSDNIISPIEDINTENNLAYNTGIEERETSKSQDSIFNNELSQILYPEGVDEFLNSDANNNNINDNSISREIDDFSYTDETNPDIYSADLEEMRNLIEDQNDPFDDDDD